MVKLFSGNLDPKKIRINIIKLAKIGNSVHIACAFSIVEILCLLYQEFVKIDKENLKNPDRDLLCLSKGHGVMALYSIFLEMDLLSVDVFNNYFQDGSILKGLSDVHVPGVEVSGGSLGHGICVSVGHAFALKLKKKSNVVYCIVGDGEMNEGSVWESLLFAAHNKLDNFFLIIDANGFQAMGECSEVLNCESFLEKMTSFCFDAEECDGHSLSKLKISFNKLLTLKNGKPKTIIARTVKGKGISFMEKKNQWHYTRLTDEMYSKCIRELS